VQNVAIERGGCVLFLTHKHPFFPAVTCPLLASVLSQYLDGIGCGLLPTGTSTLLLYWYLYLDV